MIYIVGSGPSGISCAQALLRKGLQVTILDAGIELEQEKQKVLETVSKQSSWNTNSLHQLRSTMNPLHQDGPLKLSYGSDYPYREVQEHFPFTLNDVLCKPSFAKGGLSNVWGSSLMPYAATDFDTWPISLNDLEQPYKEVISFMPFTGIHDDLEYHFPLYTNHLQEATSSKQAILLLNSFQKHKKRLNETGFFFGKSRLATRFKSSQKKPGCNYSGLCLYGCPYKLIYSTTFTLEDMKKNKNFHYIQNVIVERFTEKGNAVSILAHVRLTRQPLTFSASKIFLACNSLMTTRIMLSSLEAYEKEITLKDSQHFVIPCLLFQSAGDVTQEKLHTLCQLYLEIDDKKIDEHAIHLQMYTYNDVYEEALKSFFGKLYPFFKNPLKIILKRLVVIKGYLHSDSSSQIGITLKKGNPDQMVLRMIKNPLTKKKVRKIAMKLLCNAFSLGFLPLITFIKMSKPGGGNHYGGSFPMRKNPQPFESDILGRPSGFKHVHLVDSSVFPTISSQAITLNAMANAYRIGTLFDKK